MILQSSKRFLAYDMFHSACVYCGRFLIDTETNEHIPQGDMLLVCLLCNFLPRRKKGWDVFVKGELENLRDSQRHVFLYSTDKNAKIIPSDEKKMKLVWLSGFIRAMANWAISMIYLSFILFLLTIYGKGLLFWYGVVIALCTALLFFTSAASFFVSLAMKKNPKKYMENGGYRLLDYGTRLATLVLILMAILLVLDSAFRGF